VVKHLLSQAGSSPAAHYTGVRVALRAEIAVPPNQHVIYCSCSPHVDSDIKVICFTSPIKIRLFYSATIVVVNLVLGHKRGFSNRSTFLVCYILVASISIPIFASGGSRSRICVLLPLLYKRRAPEVGRIFTRIHTTFKLDSRVISLVSRKPQQSSGN